MSKKRESGFYWVKTLHGLWMVAAYIKGIGWGSFYEHPEDYPRKDDHFAEIDDRPIVRVETKPKFENLDLP